MTDAEMSMRVEQKSGVYLSYMLRLWTDACDGQARWRASLESVQTSNKIFFSTVEELNDFLTTLMAQSDGDQHFVGDETRIISSNRRKV